LIAIPTKYGKEDGNFKQEAIGASKHEQALISGAWRRNSDWIRQYRDNARRDYDELYTDKEACCKAPPPATYMLLCREVVVEQLLSLRGQS
jgi:hypothetical protein